MASSLAETVINNFLNCSICFETYRDPRALPCHHAFCRKCLEQCLGSSEDKRTLVCPVCREEVKLSKEGVNKLPVHFLVSSLQDTVDMETMIDTPSRDIPCGNCRAPGNKACVRCVDCKEYLCETCHTHHKTFKAMKDHKVIAMEAILSGKVNLTKEEENRYCKAHEKMCEYYCETEKKSLCRDCVILNECPYEHSRISLKKAAQIHCDELHDLLQKNRDTLTKYEEAVAAIKGVRQVLEINSQFGKKAMKKAEKECIDKVKKTFQEFEADLQSTKFERMTELRSKEDDLHSTIGEIKSVIEHTQSIIQSDSEYEIVSSHTLLSTQLQQLSNVTPVIATQTLGYIEFEPSIPKNFAVGRLRKLQTSGGNEGQLRKRKLSGGKWKLTGQFSTREFKKICGLALDQNGRIVLSSLDQGVRVFSRAGKVKCDIYNSPGSSDVAVSHENKYHSLPIGKPQIMTNDRNGRKLRTAPLVSVEDIKSDANSLTIDSSGKIIVGQVEDTISIHNADGSLISKFATHYTPYRLAVTSNGDIVCSFLDAESKQSESVQLMDYSGGNVRVIQPPTEVNVWTPGCMCCRQEELFVCNDSSGNPHGVYRYTSEGNYLDCVTTEVRSPSGIALSKDGTELFVADTSDNCVMIFQRP